MAGKKRRNHDLPLHITKTSNGYRYQRRVVPATLIPVLGFAGWDLTLGKDTTAALRKGLALTDDHTRLLDSLKTPQAQNRFVDMHHSHDAANALRVGLAGDKPANIQKVREAEHWRATERILDKASQKDPAGELTALAKWLAQAFGDDTHYDTTDDPHTAVIVEHLSPLPPPTPAAARLFKAQKQMVIDRIIELKAELTPDAAQSAVQSAPVEIEADDPNKPRLSAVLHQYFKIKGREPQTQRAYRTRINRLIDRSGDMPLDEYTRTILRGYRDDLVEGDDDHEPMKASSVRQYFNPLRTLWRWAPKEFEGYADLTMPIPDLPDAQEGTPWQPFKPDELKKVKALLVEAWGPDSPSKLAPKRRAAFLMAVRVMLHTGLRPVEVFKLTPADVHDGRLYVTKTKTRRKRELPIAAGIADFVPFMAAGGFASELATAAPTTLSGSLADTFTAVIRANGFTNERQVLYSLKHTLVARIQVLRPGRPDLIQAVIGHRITPGLGSTENYMSSTMDLQTGPKVLQTLLDELDLW